MKFFVDRDADSEEPRPALLAYNSAVFSDDDLRSLSQIGDSLKKHTEETTGRFGLGASPIVASCD